ncbi:MAG: hypothetical protein ACKO1N_05615 [Erythrobacter sp.]
MSIVSMGSREDWQRAHRWALADRSAILRFVADEVIRQRAPSCVAEIDENGGHIYLRLAEGAVVPPPPAERPEQVKAVAFVNRYRDLRSKLGNLLLIAAVLLAGALWLGEKTLTTPLKGMPLNDAVRYDAEGGSENAGIAMLMRFTDPSLPEITGRGGNDTASVSLLLIPLEGGKPRLIPVAKKLSVQLSSARIIGSDGQTLWFDVTGLQGVRLRSGDLIGPEDLAKANPSIAAAIWDDQRGPDIVDGKLHLVNSDRSAAFDIDPESLVATPTKPKRTKDRFRPSDPEDSLPEDLRIGPDRDALIISRVDTKGKELWRVDTGMDRISLTQILPGQDVVAFFGARPKIPDKLSEPLVVLVKMDTGQITTYGLWEAIETP